MDNERRAARNAIRRLDYGIYPRNRKALVTEMNRLLLEAERMALAGHYMDSLKILYCRWGMLVASGSRTPLDVDDDGIYGGGIIQCFSMAQGSLRRGKKRVAAHDWSDATFPVDMWEAEDSFDADVALRLAKQVARGRSHD